MLHQVGPYEDNMVDYLHYLTVERGLSANTRASYQQDLRHFFTYLIEQEKSMPLANIDRFTIMAFLGELEKTASHVTRSFTWCRHCESFSNLRPAITGWPLIQ